LWHPRFWDNDVVIIRVVIIHVVIIHVGIAVWGFFLGNQDVSIYGG
jgi:hypothetical protein